jgi:GDP/UDP-N,N'-diacetylbacillosamine 2-epimerase (hydrolysing)
MTRRIGVLTSSRADYGIYKPLLEEIAKKPGYELVIIVFGMHLLDKFGRTVDEILKDQYGKVLTVDGMSNGDSEIDITESYSQIILNFRLIWSSERFDLVFALGDRFEMSAAVQSSIPFRIKIAHIHGGETTLGAIDNIYRHQISLASYFHFTSSDVFAKRVAELTGTNENIFPVGSISLDGISKEVFPAWKVVCKQFSLPSDCQFVLVTIHPETVHPETNKRYVEIIQEALTLISEDLAIIITMPNADTQGSLYRIVFLELKEAYPDRIFLIESFGRKNYFSAMRNARYLLGNTSSGIIEAASFGKYVVNLGDRQKGRLRSENVYDIGFDTEKILECHRKVSLLGDYEGSNSYHCPDTINKIIDIIDEKLL